MTQCLLLGFDYKIAAHIGPNRNKLSPMLTVLDTGVGPNLIREEVCPEKSLQNIDTTRHIANFRGSSRHKLHTLGIVNLTVQVGTQTNKVPFVAVRNLGADALVGCSCTDHYVEAIMCIECQIVFENGDVVPIQRQRALSPIVGPHYEPPTVSSRSKNSINAVRTV